MARLNTPVDSGNYLQASTGLGLAITDPIWLSIWFRRSIANDRQFMAIRTDSNGGWRLRCNGGAIQVQTYNDGGTLRAAQAAGSLALNTWGHVVAWAATNNTRSVSLDGGAVVTDSTALSVATTGAPTRVVVGTGGSVGSHFAGSYAFVAVWRGTPTDDDRLALASGVHPSLVRPSTLLECWDLAGVNSPERGLRGTPMALVGTPTSTPSPRMFRPAGRSLIVVPSAGGGGSQSAFSTPASTTWTAPASTAVPGARTATSTVTSASWTAPASTAAPGTRTATSTVVTAIWTTAPATAIVTGGAVSTPPVTTWTVPPAIATPGARTATSTVATATWTTAPATARGVARTATTPAVGTWTTPAASATAGTSGVTTVAATATWTASASTATAGAALATAVPSALAWTTVEARATDRPIPTYTVLRVVAARAGRASLTARAGRATIAARTHLEES